MEFFNVVIELILKFLYLVSEMRKILQKIKKHGNEYYRYFGTWSMQTKYLEFIKRYLIVSQNYNTNRDKSKKDIEKTKKS